MKASVVFIEGRSYSEEELNKIRPFEHILQYFAGLHRVRLEVDAPHGKAIAPSAGKPNVVCVHFFSHPDDEEFSAVISAGKIYGFDLPNFAGDKKTQQGFEFMDVNDAASLLRTTQRGFASHRVPLITQDRNYQVASLMGQDIYIRFDIAHRRWLGDEFVLLRILSWAFSAMFPGKTHSSKSAFARTLRRQKARQLVSEDFDVRLKTSLIVPIRNELVSIEKGLDKTEDEYMVLATFYLRSASERENIERLLSLVNFSDTDLGQEFDQILAMDKVLGIEVKSGESAIYVYTQPLRLEMHSARPFVGQYKIGILAAQDQRLSVIVKNWGWRGPALHPHSRLETPISETPCWGGVIGGPMAKALADYDNKSIVHLALAFLELHDVRFAVAVRVGMWLGEEPPELPSFFPDDQARRDARDAYIALVGRVKSSQAKHVLSSQLAKLDESQGGQFRQLLTSRTRINVKRAEYAGIADVFNNFSIDSEKALISGRGNRILYLRLGENYLWAVFSPSGALPAPLGVFLTPEQCGVKAFFPESDLYDLGQVEYPALKTMAARLESDGTINFNRKELDEIAALVAWGKSISALLKIYNIVCESRSGAGSQPELSEVSGA